MECIRLANGMWILMSVYEYIYMYNTWCHLCRHRSSISVRHGSSRLQSLSLRHGARCTIIAWLNRPHNICLVTGHPSHQLWLLSDLYVGFGWTGTLEKYDLLFLFECEYECWNIYVFVHGICIDCQQYFFFFCKSDLTLLAFLYGILLRGFLSYI